MAANQEIRNQIEQKRVKHWEVARELGINAATLSRWLRMELPESKKKMLLDAISKISF